MVKIYVMESCPDCAGIKEQVLGNEKYQVIDIGQHIRNLKEFLKLRDSYPIFDSIRKTGSIGIPCFVKDDGGEIIISFSPDEVGLVLESVENGSSCSLDGSGC